MRVAKPLVRAIAVVAIAVTLPGTAFLLCACDVVGGWAQPTDWEEPADGDIRVACVGDSITYGFGIRDKGNDTYPAQLDEMLGDGYSLRNFGVSAATVLTKGWLPYSEVPAFDSALDYEPDVVVILLGTNDSAVFNWVYEEDFTSDYEMIISSFKSLPTNPTVFICYPPPVYSGAWAVAGHSDSVIRNEIIPRIDHVAEETDVSVIDLYDPLRNISLFPDGLHPNAEGAGIIAHTVYVRISQDLL
ncbi:MAG: GDSL-type esterase/lipase family protein [Planctomycetota bacterium]|jgi:lysophospholipase L1-like esterase